MKEHAENEPKTAAPVRTTDETVRTPDPADAPAAARPGLPWIRLSAAILAGIPFFCTLPYTVHSWRTSPMDKKNWIFHLAFLLFAVCCAPAVKDSAKALKRSAADIPAVLFAVGFAMMYAAGVVRDIYMVRILAGTAFWWTGVWFFCGWPGAWAAIPAFAALSLGCTSSTFVLCNHFLLQPQTVLFLKIGGTVVCALICAAVMLTNYVMKFEVFCFLIAAGAILFVSQNIREGGKTAPPFRPRLSAAPEGFTLSEIPPTKDQIRFFEGAEVHQYGISDGVFQCSILEIKCGDDIHKIHPASHCLRSGGAVIQSESVVTHTLADGRVLPVTEIRSGSGNSHALIFVWYTGPKTMTGSFYAFRSKWSPSDQWYSYQIVTRIHDGDEDAARKFLLDVLSKL